MTKSKFWKKLEESASCIQKSFGRETMPSTLVVLGSGFKDFAETLKNKQRQLFQVRSFFAAVGGGFADS